MSQDAKMSLNRSDCESLLQLEKENPLEVETLCDFIESYEPEESTTQGRVWIIASSSVDSDKVPATTKYIRGQNHISAYIIREIEENPNECIVEWIACVDFKGNIPRYVLDLAFTTKMVDFGIYLRKYVQRLYQKPLATTMSRE
ncbi:steroidogenic acute regulatory protein-like [Stomoxys calcitrans]|uniref:steroidogenic acute regulatory protein-like n=1 Tax=Stomoxys calcitrans TaxID=35570 RepID=UPI0027E3552E|nr:steroidogenic acute regulatory protein-like [Stomoxys calcitrans]